MSLYCTNTPRVNLMGVSVNLDALFFALEESQTGNELLEVIDSFVSESAEG